MMFCFKMGYKLSLLSNNADLHFRERVYLVFIVYTLDQSHNKIS